MCILRTFLISTYLWTFVRHFYYWVEVKSIWKKSKMLKQIFDALKMNNLTIVRVLKNFTNMAENERHRELQTTISCIFNCLWSITRVWIESLVPDHFSKLQHKKLSRTRDILCRTRDIVNFPTQGCADTTFYTIYWEESYGICWVSTEAMGNCMGVIEHIISSNRKQL